MISSKAGALARLLRPRSIAAVGGREAERVIEQCDSFGFRGKVWPVNPRRTQIRGRKCFARVADLPESPDAVFVGIPRVATIECVRELARIGAGGAICYASGFLESEPESAGGAALQQELISAAGAMPIVGPNCYGLLNATSGAALWPDQHGLNRVEQGAALLLQSSNLAINISMQRRGLPISYLGTVGNQAQTGISEMAESLLEDPNTTALGLHIEGIDSVRSLERMALTARKLGKPIVAIRTGRSRASREAVFTHTASLAGNNEVAFALFRRLGISLVQTLPELLETLKLLHVHGPLSGNSLSSMSCSGGEAALISDTATGLKIRFPPLDPKHRNFVKSTLPELVTAANPLDYHTFYWADEARMQATFSAMLAGAYDLSFLVLDYPRTDRCDGAKWDIAIRAFVGAAKETGAKSAIVATLSENIPEDLPKRLHGEGIAALGGLREALKAAEAAAAIGNAYARPVSPPTFIRKLVSGAPALLNEVDSKRLLAKAGISIPKGMVANSVETAEAAAEEIGYPVAVKALGIPHKTDVRAVRLEIRDAPILREAASSLLALGNHLLVEEMIMDGIAELRLGLIRDPACGLAMAIGSGGTSVELEVESQTLMLAPTVEEIQFALAELRVSRLLRGYRGQPHGDLDATIDAAMAMAEFGIAYADRVEEAEVNPLIVRPKGRGVAAVDALVQIREARTWRRPRASR